MFFSKSTRLKTMPLSGDEGCIQISTLTPLCNPTPENDIGFLTVFWVKYDTPNF